MSTVTAACWSAAAGAATFGFATWLAQRGARNARTRDPQLQHPDICPCGSYPKRHVKYLAGADPWFECSNPYCDGTWAIARDWVSHPWVTF